MDKKKIAKNTLKSKENVATAESVRITRSKVDSFANIVKLSKKHNTAVKKIAVGILEEIPHNHANSKINTATATQNTRITRSNSESLAYIAKSVKKAEPVIEMPVPILKKIPENQVNTEENTATATQHTRITRPKTESLAKIAKSVKIAEPVAKMPGPISKKRKEIATLKRSKVQPQVGDFCFGKVRGYCEWPAVIKVINKASVTVEFLNSGEISKCAFEKIFDLQEGLRFLQETKSSQFKRAVREMAVIMKSQMRKSKSPKFGTPLLIQQYTEAYN